MHSIIQLKPESYSRHLIHGADRRWAETNCYMDVLIELIHSLGFEPIAALPITISVDFEFDQWTFFKFSHQDLLNLYGMEIQELNPWQDLAMHVQEQVENGRPVLVELDSFYLPDTAGSAYKIANVKSTVAVNEIDIEARHMGYFHGQGYYHLDGDDFEQVFQLDGKAHRRILPPYIELVKLRSKPGDLSAEETLRLSLDSLRRQLSILPVNNPFLSFRTRFESDLEWLKDEPIERFHDYSFATLRQYGACYELVETYIRWLIDSGEEDLQGGSDAFARISSTAKTFQFKLARSLARKKPLNLDPLSEMAEDWQLGTEILTDKYL